MVAQSSSPSSPSPSSDPGPAHFQGKDALSHVVERQTKGILDSTEIHGLEIPGHISAGCESSRETAILFPLLWLVLHWVEIPFWNLFFLFLFFGFGWLLWKCGRSARLAWARLERLHRIMEEERWEIEHHRAQEREELKILYQAKGFSGKLLEDVVDVLMADGDRLLRVMLQEELGFSLESYEHPLKQGVGAALGVMITLALCLGGFLLYSSIGLISGSILVIALSSAISAHYLKNKIIPAIVWNVSLGCLAFSTCYFLLSLFVKSIT